MLFTKKHTNGLISGTIHLELSSSNPSSFLAASIISVVRQPITILSEETVLRNHTSIDPVYIRISQDIFLNLGRHGLLEKQEKEQTYCEGCSKCVK
jgi:leucyl-tRNA synthetase